MRARLVLHLGGVGVVLAGALLVVRPATATPASFVVTSTADDADATVGDGLCATAAATCTLRAALQEAGANTEAVTITVPAGTYIVGSPLPVAGSPTITGAGAGTTIIDAGGSHRAFDIADATVTLAQLTVRNGLATADGGGGIQASHSHLTLTDVAFTSNRADADGGAVGLVDGSLTITRGTFSDDTGQAGGAIFASEAAVHVVDSSFTSNGAVGQGGAIFAAFPTTLTISGSTFTTNSATTNGGAVAIDGTKVGAPGPFSITGSTFTGNIAGADGGALAATGFGDRPLEISGNTFHGNQAGGSGGAAVLDLGEYHIVGDTFTGNTAVTGNGGAIAAGGSLTVEGGSFDGNSAAGSGGAIQALSDASISGATFTHNTADGPGAAINLANTLPSALGVNTFSGNTSEVGSGDVSSSALLPGVDGLNPVGTSQKPIDTLSGAGRIGTAIAISKASFVDAGATSMLATSQGASQSHTSSATVAPSDHAGAVVLTRDDVFADALAGGPLAVARNAPVLLTPSSGLDPAVEAEIIRVLPGGGTVYILGGDRAVAAAVAERLTRLGFSVTRYGGSDRYTTAVAIADIGLGGPSSVVEASGAGFADALAASPAASSVAAAVLLTNGSAMAPATADYLARHPGGRRTAIGGPAATADPGAAPIVGVDRYDTAARVASVFFPRPRAIGIASGIDFPDALAGGAHIGRLGDPILLTRPDALPAAAISYLTANRATITQAYVYGGNRAVDETVHAALTATIG